MSKSKAQQIQELEEHRLVTRIYGVWERFGPTDRMQFRRRSKIWWEWMTLLIPYEKRSGTKITIRVMVLSLQKVYKKRTRRK